MSHDYFGPDYDYGDYEPDFADPGGNSALRASSTSNPRNLPCPSCGGANRLMLGTDGDLEEVVSVNAREIKRVCVESLELS